MPIEGPQPESQHTLWLEGFVLVGVTPFLLFPSVYLAATVVALLVLCALWLLPIVARRWPWPPSSPFDLLLLLWSAVLLVAVWVSADPALTWPKFTGLILGLAWWRFLDRAIQSPRFLRVGVLFYVLVGLGFVFLGALAANWLSKVPFLLSLIAYLPQGIVALPGSPTLGVHTNQIAGTLLFVIPVFLSLLIGFFWSPPTRRLQIACWISTALLIILLLLTQSRMGWIAFALSLLVLVFLWCVVLPPRDRLRRRLAAAVGILSLLLVTAIVLIGPQRLQTLWLDPEQESVVGNLGSVGFRQEVWRWGVTAVEDFTFTGTGLGTFRAVVRRFYPLNVTLSYDIAHAHNLLLQVALDVGIPGLVVYLAMVLLAFALGLQVAKRDMRLRPYALGLLTALAALHLFGLADTLALGSKSHLLFWLALALLTAMHRLVQPALVTGADS